LTNLKIDLAAGHEYAVSNASFWEQLGVAWIIKGKDQTNRLIGTSIHQAKCPTIVPSRAKLLAY